MNNLGSDPDAIRDNSWYVVYSKPRQEWVALQNLLNQGFKAWLPRFTQWRKCGGRWQSLANPMFPRYLLLRPVSPQQSIGPVRSTVGVSGLVHFGGKPACMSGEVAHQLHLIELRLGEMPSDTSPFSPGAAVRVSDGPLRGLEGIVTHSARDRVCVLLSLLGREKEVALPSDMLVHAS